MQIIQSVDAHTFQNNMPNVWQDSFKEEFDQYGTDTSLIGLYIDGEYIGGLWLGYNPDLFQQSEGIKIIENLIDQHHIKISYFYVKKEYTGQGLGKNFLLDLIKQNNETKYFLTCTGDKLKNYYIGIGFDYIHNEGDKNILVYNTA